MGTLGTNIVKYPYFGTIVFVHTFRYDGGIVFLRHTPDRLAGLRVVSCLRFYSGVLPLWAARLTADLLPRQGNGRRPEDALATHDAARAGVPTRKRTVQVARAQEINFSCTFTVKTGSSSPSSSSPRS